MTHTQQRELRPLRQVLRQTNDPELIEALMSAASDLNSELGEKIRSELAWRPSKKDLRYFIPLFASWPPEIQQRTIQGSTGILKSVLQSLLDGPLTADQWAQVADAFPDSEASALMRRSHIDDGTLLRLARNEGPYIRLRSRITSGGQIAHDILMKTSDSSPARLLYAAAHASTTQIANTARDVFTDEDLARHVTPENVEGAWIVAYSKAATDERVLRWLRWLRQTDSYSDLRRRASYASPRRMSEVDDSMTMTAYSLSAVAAARGLSAPDLPSLLSFFDIPFDWHSSEDAERDNETWKASVALRTQIRASADDLRLLAETLPWEPEVLSRSGSPREDIMRHWVDQHPDGDAITLCAGQMLTIPDSTDREVAVSLGYALSYLSRQALGSGHLWALVRTESLKLRPSAVDLLRELADDDHACTQLEFDQRTIRRRLNQLALKTEPYVDGDGDKEAPLHNPVDAPPIALHSNSDLRRLLGIQRWLSLNGHYGRPTISMRHYYALTGLLTPAGLETFGVLLESWQGTFDELVAVSVSLSEVVNQ